MKKYIYVINAIYVMAKLQSSRRVEGVLFKDANTGQITFKAYNRQPRERQRDRLVKKLPWGWVKESLERIKFFASLPKDMGTANMMMMLDENSRDAKNALIEREWEACAGEEKL